MEGDGVCKDKFLSASLTEIEGTCLRDKEVYMAVSTDSHH